MKNFSKTIFAAAALTFAMGANAAVKEFTSNTAYNIEEFDGDLALTKFDSALGTLTSVKFELFNTISGSIEVINGGATPGKFTVTAGGQIDGDVVGNALTASDTITKEFSLDPGQVGFIALTPWTVSKALTLSSSAALSAFTGSDEYHALLTGWSSAETSGSGNATYNPIIFLDGYAKVTYTYDVLPVPEPETYALMLAGLGLVGFAARRRKSA